MFNDDFLFLLLNYSDYDLFSKITVHVERGKLQHDKYAFRISKTCRYKQGTVHTIENFCY